MMKIVNHLINGTITPGRSGRFGHLYDPAFGEQTGQVALANREDVNVAVAAAMAAFPGWAATPVGKRSQIAFKFKELLEEHLEELAELVTLEHGKTLEDARGSIRRGIEVVDYACGAPSLLRGTYSENVGTGIDTHALRQPLGVCVGITPFNFPAMVPLWMFPLAIVCGNTFVLKPSEKDPSCSLRMAELFYAAGLPKGVLNVVQGDREAVDVLLVHPDVQALSFVGSTPVAEYIYRTATHHGKRAQALGGAKNHCVLMPDAPLESAANAIIGAAYGSAGERCMAISVVVAVGDEVADALVKTLVPKINALKMGSGLDAGVDIGPLVTMEHRARVMEYVNIGVEEGATLVVDGRGYQQPQYPKGFFMGGCLFDNVTPSMRIYKEEIFGPVLSIVRVPDYESALKLVNDNEYGNGTAIFTREGYYARDYASRVRVGLVGVNIPIPVPVAYHSFGGWKRSLFGDTHMHGPEGIHFYTRLKTITTRWSNELESAAQFAIPTLIKK